MIVTYNLPRMRHLFAARGRDIHDPFWDACVALGSPLIDRSGAMTSPFRHTITAPLPPAKATIDAGTAEESIGEICDRRARALMARSKAQQKPIMLFYSGGIDSTAALVAFLRVCTDADLRSNLIVTVNARAKEENPEFWRNVIRRRGLNVTPASPSVRSMLTREMLAKHILVTGEIGDQIFGSVYYKRHLRCVTDSKVSTPTTLEDGRQVPRGTWQLVEPDWEPLVIATLAETLEGSFVRARAVLDHLRPTLAKSPLPIQNALDFGWALNFILKYQYVVYRFSDALPDLTEDELSAIQHFYDHPSFEAWAQTARYHVSGGKILRTNLTGAYSKTNDRTDEGYGTYKRALKFYIWAFDQASDYFWGKAKVASLTGRFDNSMFFRLADGTAISGPPFVDVQQSLRWYDKAIGDKFDDLIGLA